MGFDQEGGQGIVRVMVVLCDLMFGCGLHILPGESQGWGSLVGCRLWGRTESDTTEATQPQQHKSLPSYGVHPSYKCGGLF